MHGGTNKCVLFWCIPLSPVAVAAALTFSEARRNKTKSQLTPVTLTHIKLAVTRSLNTIQTNRDISGMRATNQLSS